MWSGQWPGPGPAGSGRGLKYEIVLRAGPGHNCRGPGRGLIIQFAGRARARSAQLLRARAGASNHVCGPGLAQDFRPVQGPSRAYLFRRHCPTAEFDSLYSGCQQSCLFVT